MQSIQIILKICKYGIIKRYINLLYTHINAKIIVIVMEPKMRNAYERYY